MSRLHYLSDKEITEAISCAGRLSYAVRNSGKTRFLVFAIEANEQVQLNGLTKLKQALKDIGISKTMLYGAGTSNVRYLYVFWSDWVDVAQVYKTIESILRDRNMCSESSGITMLMPDSILPLPLQSGWAWLDDQAAVKVCREDLSVDQAINKFMLDLHNQSNDWQDVSNSVNRAITDHLDSLLTQPDQAEQVEIDRPKKTSTRSAARKGKPFKGIQLSLPLFSAGESVKREGLSDPMGLEVSRAPPEFIRNCV